LRETFYAQEAVQERLPQIEEAVTAGTMPATAAAQSLLAAFWNSQEPEPR
jgi:hypothetical protein